jgi:hypothetical protein
MFLFHLICLFLTSIRSKLSLCCSVGRLIAGEYGKSMEQMWNFPAFPFGFRLGCKHANRDNQILIMYQIAQTSHCFRKYVMILRQNATEAPQLQGGISDKEVFSFLYRTSYPLLRCGAVGLRPPSMFFYLELREECREAIADLPAIKKMKGFFFGRLTISQACPSLKLN